MRKLILLQGPPGSGKSTFVKKHNLEPFTLSPDNYRLNLGSPVLNLEGEYRIDQKHSNRAFKNMFTDLENRMKNGDFTVIDATHCSDTSFKKYKNLCEQYKYRCLLITMECEGMAELVDRNQEREEYKKVGDDVIRRMTASLPLVDVPKWIEHITEIEFDMNPDKYLGIRFENVDEYEKIVIIGDIHGCYTTLRKVIPEIDPKTLYVFVGDYLDRGCEIEETMQFILDTYNLPNFYYIEGNHERHIKSHINNTDIDTNDHATKEFINNTQPALEKFNKIDLKLFMRKLRQMVAIEKNGRKFLINHGGIPFRSDIESRGILISTSSFIKGVGKYSELDSIMATWTDNVGITQIFGHRNIQEYTMEYTKNAITLEDKVEMGGYLRYVTITNDNVECNKIANEIISDAYMRLNNERNMAENIDIPVDVAIDIFRKNEALIKEKKFGNISSFNFTKNVFLDQKWNGVTCKTRGLFINTNTNKIVARGYDKFFNIGERKVNWDTVEKKYKLPICGYDKENGFLGLLGYDEEIDELIFTSKSVVSPNSAWDKDKFKYKDMNHNDNIFRCKSYSIDYEIDYGENFAEYANLFRQTIYDKIGYEKLNSFIKPYLKEHNLSLAFECIHVDDPHIIEETINSVVLLDAFKRTIKTEKMPYGELLKTFRGYNVKQRLFKCENENPTEEYVKNEVNQYIIEGCVIEDANGNMCKYKSDYYNFWKAIRGILERYVKNDKPFGRLPSHFSNEYLELFADFKTHYIDITPRGNVTANVIEARKIYEKNKAEGK